MTDYELWSFGTSQYTVSGWSWIFHGYRRIPFQEVLDHLDFGYYVRKVIGDRSDTIPLFPILDSSEEYPDERMD